MAFDFPSNPITNDEHTISGKIFKYNGNGWIPISLLSPLNTQLNDTTDTDKIYGFRSGVGKVEWDWLILKNDILTDLESGGTIVFATITELNNYLTNIDRTTGSIATCLETEGIIYILNNLKDAWLTIDINSKLDSSLFYSHTGATNPHNTSFSNLTNTGHTNHIISDIIGLQEDLNTKIDLSVFNSHTGDTSIHYTKSSINLTDLGISAHTHVINDITNLQTSLDLKSTKITFDNTPWVVSATTFTLSPIKRYDFQTTACITSVVWTLSPMTDVTEDCEYWFKLVIGTGGTSHTFTGCTFGINNDPVVADATYEFHIKKTIVFIRRIV